MPKVTFSNAKGILQEAGSGFQVNDAPILTESETVAGNVVITVTPSVIDSDDGSLLEIKEKYFLIATPNEKFYVWFDSGDAAAEDPEPHGLTAANSIRISDDTTAIASNADACNAILHRLLSTDGSIADGIINYSTATVDADVLDNVLGVDNDAAGEGADKVDDRWEVTTDGTDVVIAVLPVGSIAGSFKANVVDAGNLVNLGSVDPDSWAVALSDGTGDNGSALQTFGTSVVSNAGSETCECTLANATAGTKKLVVQSGVGIIAMSYSDFAGASKTATFNAPDEALYLLSTGVGWAVITNVGSVGIA